MYVAPITTGRAAATPATPAPSAARGQISSDFQTFLKMLTAQIQNQDPLNPTPSDEFAVQLATFSSVEQQVRTNDLLVALGADRAELVVRNAAGREVERLDIPVSTDPVRWTGIGPNGSPYLHGTYSFELVSYSNGTAVSSG